MFPASDRHVGVMAGRVDAIQELFVDVHSASLSSDSWSMMTDTTDMKSPQEDWPAERRIAAYFSMRPTHEARML
jgi:hypothetical protein